MHPLSLEFVDLYVDFILNKSVEKQFAAFQTGFNLICQDCAIKVKGPISSAQNLPFLLFHVYVDFPPGRDRTTDLWQL